MACLKAIFGTFAPQSLSMSAHCLLHILLLFLVLKASTSRLVTEDSINADSGEDNEDNANLFTSFNSSRRILSDCQTTGNPIDDCWRCDSNWQSNRKRLADCAIGFGQNAIGGKNGEIYVVTDPTDDDAVNPKVGTLRYGVIQSVPLWITFARDMNIQLTQELIMNSYKTIDGRGSNIHIANGPCITLQYVSHIIIHGIHIHDCKPAGNANVRSSPTHYGWRGVSDGDGISLFGATNVWIDHCTLAKCTDGLIDAIRQSTAITISNNYFSNHDKVMLLGHSDQYPKDKIMQVTIAYNHFGEGLVERIPRCRFGNFHVENNDYTQWGMYAVGGSSNPTINVEGNRFLAPAKVSSKQVTKREHTNQATWKNWNWRSEGNLFLNGAYFVPSGSDSGVVYSKTSSPSLSAKPAAYVEYLTANAGVMSCSAGSRKWSQLLLLMLSTFKIPVSASNSTPTSPERVRHSQLGPIMLFGMAKETRSNLYTHLRCREK